MIDVVNTFMTRLFNIFGMSWDFCVYLTYYMIILSILDYLFHFRCDMDKDSIANKVREFVSWVMYG